MTQPDDNRGRVEEPNPTDPMELILRVWADLEAELNRALQEPIADSEFFPNALWQSATRHLSGPSGPAPAPKDEESPAGEHKCSSITPRLQ